MRYRIEFDSIGKIKCLVISIGVPQLKDPINILISVIFSKAISYPLNRNYKKKRPQLLMQKIEI